MPIVVEQLSADGPIIEIRVHISEPRHQALKRTGKPIPNPVLARGLIDTGATCSCVDSAILRQLQLQPTGTTSIYTPSTTNAPHTANQYDVSLWLPANSHNIKITVPVIEADFSAQGIGMLIGRDVLDDCLLVYNGPSGSVTLAFQ
jgi:hypothetical protein